MNVSIKNTISILITHIFYGMLCATNKFPTDFKFGVSTSAFQIEGGWNADGKSESIWDDLVHKSPELIIDHSTGDIACDSYNLWHEDIKLLKELNVKYYRFSLSWPRILPTGFPNVINSIAVHYYNNLINGLLAEGIEPVVTLYHWDLPKILQDLGGWLNPDIIYYLYDFAYIVFKKFGDRVKLWITINEPSSICLDAYGLGLGAPNIKVSGLGEYICGKNVLLAHATIYRLYKVKFQSQQMGKIGISIDSIWAEPKTNDRININAANRELQMSTGWFANPIFSKDHYGGYPQILIERIGTMSKMENFTRSRLPSLSQDEKRFIHGTFDFFGLNHYHTWLVTDHEYPINDPVSNKKDKGTLLSQDCNWKPSPQIVPWGIRKLLNWIKNEYGNPPVIITENGLGLLNTDDSFNDSLRIYYIKSFLDEILKAIHEDDCNVKGYIYWSLMDNMEWREGYTMKYGLYNVNFTTAKLRPRTAKSSANFYKTFIQKLSMN